ncbi:MFS transporter [Lactobacillus hamsteri]|uniref:MFS transporter n=1 Tax=Lactobacillus hamsteri TaxID=96565 RepID=UPI000467F003|nr:MFS transporter [Lactobacillus hamsteri]
MSKNLIQKENLNIRNLLIGRVATNIADSLFYMTILWFFKTKFHSPIVLSLIFIADSTIDMLAFLFGPLIDRTYIKKLLNVTTIGQIVLSIIATILFFTKSHHSLIVIFLLAIYVLSTIGSTLIYPAEEKILPALVTKDRLSKVNGIFQMTYQTLDLFLDALATLLITYLSLNGTMIISAFTFSIALTFYVKLLLPKKLLIPKNKDFFTNNYWQDLMKGWNILKNEGKILILIIPFAVTNLFYGIASVGLPYFASKYLTNSAIGYGGLELTSSIGGLLGSLLVQQFSFGKKKLEKWVTICLFFSGISVILEAIIANFVPFLLIIFALSSALWISMMNINFEVLVQESFNPHILGRIETINSSIINCMIPIGSFLGGIIVQNLGSNWTIALEGIAEVITSIFYFFIFNR